METLWTMTDSLLIGGISGLEPSPLLDQARQGL